MVSVPLLPYAGRWACPAGTTIVRVSPVAVCRLADTLARPTAYDGDPDLHLTGPRKGVDDWAFELTPR
jgi:hypothetical protein